MDAWLGIKGKAPAPKASGSGSGSKKPAAPTGPSNRLRQPGDKPARVIEPASLPWTEKWRPKTLDDIAAQESTVTVLRKTLSQANVRCAVPTALLTLAASTHGVQISVRDHADPQLFYGPAGTGKTSTILALCRQLFGPETFRSRVLELNASDERGISVVREKVKSFAKVAISHPKDSAYPAPPYKVIILDEADSMTQDAQSALRRIMETYSRTTRFCLICNYVTRIIEPITSRCTKFRFRPLDLTNTTSKLEAISVAEKVRCAPGALEALIKAADGDLRRAITYLQSASRLHGEEDVTPRSIQEIAGVVPDAEMDVLVAALGVGDNAPAKTTFEGVRSAVEHLVRSGFSAVQILSQLHDLLILDPVLGTRAKCAIGLAMGEADKCLTDGADEVRCTVACPADPSQELQLFNLALRIRTAVGK